MNSRYQEQTAPRTNPERFSFLNADGLSIACVKWHSRGRARGIVQIAHGLGEHMGRYAELADALVDQGFAVYGNDHRGHGLTARRPGGLGDFGPGGFDQVVEDMISLRVIAKQDYSHIPYILLGHGMGSFAAQQFILDHSHSINGLALSGSGILDGLLRIALDAPSAHEPMGLMSATPGPARTPFDWLSRDTAQVDAFVADPLCFSSLQPASMESFLSAAPRLSDPRELRKIRQDLPVYLFSGSNDPVGQQLEGVRALIHRYRSAGLSMIDHDFYLGGRHEMLHEKNRHTVIGYLLAWMTCIVERAT
jgi:alpha-beta hydrolase superfamily lysophospholipase